MDKVIAAAAPDSVSPKRMGVMLSQPNQNQRSYSIESQEYFECFDEYQSWHLEVIQASPSPHFPESPPY